MPKILVIDDDETLLDSLKLAFGSAFPDSEVVYERDFDAGRARLATDVPDIVILDLRQGTMVSNLPGGAVWADVWERRFCPIVIYTGGNGDLQPQIPLDHPFIKMVMKSANSEPELIGAITKFMPCVDAVRSLRSELDSVIHQVLRDTVGSGATDGTDKEVLLHAGRRRIAAYMDAPTIEGRRQMKSWEQYLVPAVGESPLTGDILRQNGRDAEDPTSYRLVLTPSCDLVKGRCEPTVVVARCESTANLVKKLQLSSKPSKLKENVGSILSKALTVGSYAGLVPLPNFPGRFPILVANVRSLEVIEYKMVGSTDPATGFGRIASIDSPFREQVAWAYLTVAARPGMPDRDLEPFAREIAKAHSLSTPGAPSATT